MSSSLPQFILLKSSKKDKYLRYRKEADSHHAFLQFSENEKDEDVEIQYVKFEVQKSETKEGFVHIRSCYNNKYWVRKSGGDEGESWLAVEANEPEEDSSKLCCTLFKPVFEDGGEVEVVEQDKPQTIRLVHVDQLGQQGCAARSGSDLLTLQADMGDEDDTFIAYNADSVVKLPDRVAFTNHEGKYAGVLAIAVIGGHVVFNTTEIGTPGVAIHALNRPLANPPYIECRHLNPFGWWQLNAANTLVLVRSQNPILHVTPIRLAGNKIAFRTADSWRRILQSVPSDNGDYQVLGTGTSILSNAMFGVEEPVAFRTISEVKYNVEDSRVYNIGSVEKYRDERSNSSSVDQTGSFRVAYTKSRTISWGDSVSLTTGVTASMSASIPFVGIDFGVSYSQESNQTVEFGKVEEEEEQVEFLQNLTIPSRKKIILLVVATRAQCDVPFTCRVVDTYFDGTTFSYNKTDGLFSGSNEFSFQTNILEEDI